VPKYDDYAEVIDYVFSLNKTIKIVTDEGKSEVLNRVNEKASHDRIPLS